MSDLVERVAREMCIANGGWPDEDMPNDGPRWKYWVPNARAAIAAVAKWLASNDRRYDGCCKTAAKELETELQRLRGEK